MANQELLTFVKEELARGVSQGDLKIALGTAGWSENDISEAFAVVGGSPMPQSDQSAMATPGISGSALLGAPALLGKAWTLYKQRWTTFLTIMIAPALLSILFAVGSSSMENMGIPSNPFIFFGGIFVAILVFTIINIWSSVALLHAIKGTSEQLSTTASYGRGAPHILAFVWISILTTLIVMGGFMLLIIPGIIFAFWFSFAPFVVVDDDTRGMSALLKSREYVRGRWGGVAWRMFFAGLIYIPIFIVLFILLFLLNLIKIPGAENVFSVLPTLFVTPLMMAYMFVLYENLKATRGSFVFAPTTGKKAPFIVLAILAPILIIAPVIFLASLNSARDLAREAYIKSALSGTRPSAEVYFSSQNSYEGVCEGLEIKQAIDGIIEKGAKEITCNTSMTEYAISASLPTKGYFCIDNSEKPGAVTTQGLKPTETRCPTQ